MEIRRPELAGAIHQREYDAPRLCKSEGLPRMLGMLLGRWGAPYPHKTATVHGQSVQGGE